MDPSPSLNKKTMKHTYQLLFIFCFLSLTHTHVAAQDYQVTNNNISIQKIEYYAGTTTIKLNNNTYHSSKLILNMDIYSSETETSFQIEKEFVLDEKQKVLKIEDLYFCKALIEIHQLNGQLLAKGEISDGEWQIHNPQHLFFQRVYEEDRTPSSNSMLIERSLIVVPRLYHKVYLTKTIQANIASFNELEFHAEGLDEVKIVFESEEDHYELFLEDLEDGKQVVNIEDAKNAFDESYSGNKLINIHFELKSFQLAMPIKLKNLQLIKTKIIVMGQEKNENKNLVYPNPTNGIINIQMEKAGTYKLEIHNAYHPVYLKILKVDENTQVQLPQLAPGAYVYKISNEEDEWVRKLIVQ